MNDLLLGATAMGAGCIALFFLKFWRDSHDTFHLLFAASFLLLAIQRLILAALETSDEAYAALYLPRLAAYLLIIWAVVQKNAQSRSP